MGRITSYNVCYTKLLRSWLILRGLKTLALRLKVQESNAKIIADYLLGHKNVRKVYYPGIEGTQSHRNLRCTASGYGAMLAFEVDDFSRVRNNVV